MVSTRDETLIINEIIRYLSSLGIEVKTATKARGNRGFFKEGRIDISKTLDDKNALRTLVHEFAHYVNYKLDDKLKSFEILFGEKTESKLDELQMVTAFVDENSLCKKLNQEREHLKLKIKDLSNTIKKTHPEFSLSEEFKAFKKYSRWSNIGYLEKYDRVKVHSIMSNKIYSISTVKDDFPDIPEAFVNYLQLKSHQRKRTKITRRITKLNKYYNEPCELFARFIEGIFLDSEKIKDIAPQSYQVFLEKYNKNYYPHLRELFSIIRKTL